MEQSKNPQNRAKRPILQGIRNGAGEMIKLPPRRKFKPKKCLILRFVIADTVPSKKNRAVPDSNKSKIKGILSRRHLVTKEVIDEVLKVKPFIRNSAEFKKWEDATRADLILQAARWHKTYEKHNLSYPITRCSIAIYHYWAENKRRDNSNKQESIHDILVSTGIISDDTHQCLRRTESEADVYHGEILDHITTITISAYDW
jgi:hypothetical protein